jgi:hypothetical protein
VIRPSVLGLVSISAFRLTLFGMSLSSDEILCEACRNLFADERYNERRNWYTQHETADSFKQALDLSCALCSRLYIALNLDGEYDEVGLSSVTPIVYRKHNALIQFQTAIHKWIPMIAQAYKSM